jgi:hypothetical protein
VRAIDALPWAFCALAVAWAVTLRQSPAPPAAAGTPAVAEVGTAPPAPSTDHRAAVAPRDRLDPVQALAQLVDEPGRARSAVRAALVAVLDSGDHDGHPFVIVDKAAARLWLFDGRGGVAGTTPVLLGAARGDDSKPGIGERPLEAIRPHERITPAGRFVARHGRNLTGEDVLWVDYDAAVSLHRMRPSRSAERRPQRMASQTAVDNRITWGCINVPPAFYDARLLPLVTGLQPIVYVLPETRPLATLFQGGQRSPAGRGGVWLDPVGPPLAPRRDG